jgi:hypothetical protein
MAILLGVILAAGYAQGEAGQPAAPNKTVTVQERLEARYAQGESGEPAAPKTVTVQERLEAREAQRRAAVEEQQRRKDAYERACSKPIKSEAELDHCRAAYKRLEIGKH